MKIEKSIIAPILKAMKSLTPPKDTATQAGILLNDNTLTAYNFEIGIKADLGICTGEKFVIPPKAIELIESLPDEVITVKGSSGKSIYCSIESSVGKSRFVTVKADDFQDIEEYSGERSSTTLNGNIFAESVSKVLPCCNEKSTRPAMTGVLFKSDGKQINIVACDGYKLALAKMKYSETFSMIVPKIALQKMVSLIADEDEVTVNQFSNSKAMFTTGIYTVYTQLLSGDFIDYEAVMPVEFNGVFEIDRRNFVKTINRCLICDIPTMKLSHVESGKICISAKSSLTEFIEEVEVDSIDLKEIEIGFSPKQMKTLLSSSYGDKIKLFYNKPKTPMVLVDNDNFTQLLMPSVLRKE